MLITLDNVSMDLNPTKIIAVARNYREHATEMKVEVPSTPSIFLKPPSALVGDKSVVILPSMSDRVEHEVELAIIVKDRMHKVSADSVDKHILGYAVIVDVTARDIQTVAKSKGMPWTIAKGFDTFAPLGPRIVSGEKIDTAALSIWLKVNGQYRQQGNTNQMISSVVQLVSYISGIMTLEPMDIIATGTPSGVGPMQDGDFVEAGIEGIGVLQFKVVREA
jgi:2-keto-4-pentenoate hydratase/2-oxohepta-3-ene-1,7-dioic acid hydratase in catechol pathway